MAIEDWSATASENGTVLGVNIAENCPAANVNNALRQALADVAAGINFSTLGDFLSSTSLSQARSALGVASPTSSTSLTNFGNLTNTANSIAYMAGGNNWAKFTATSFMRGLMSSGDAATAMTTLGGVSVVASSISATSGYIKLNISGTTFTLQWKDGTASAGGETAFTYPTAFTSWSRAWVNTKDSTTDYTGQRNYPQARSETTTGCTIYSASSASQSITVFALGV